MKKKYDLGKLDRLSKEDLGSIHDKLLELSNVLRKEVAFLNRVLYSSNWMLDEEVVKNQGQYGTMCAPLHDHQEKLESYLGAIRQLDYRVLYRLGRWPFDDEIPPEKFGNILAAVGVAEEIKFVIENRDSPENQSGPYLGYIYRMGQAEAASAQSLFMITNGGEGMAKDEVKSLREIVDELEKIDSRLALIQDIELDILHGMTKDMIDTAEYKVANKAAAAMDKAYYHIEDAIIELNTLLKEH